MSTNFNSSLAIAGLANSGGFFPPLGRFFTDVWEAGGFPRTPDTGQINWSTVTFPSSNNTALGYEIRKFNDSLDATFPIRVKLEYQTGGAVTSVASNFVIFITIGMGSDGAGNITNIIFPRTTMAQSQNNGPGSSGFRCYATSSDSYAGFLLGSDAVNYWWPFAIERTRDSLGNATGEGILLTYRNNTTNTNFGVAFVYIPYNTYLTYVAETSTTLQVAGVLLPTAQSSGLGIDNNITVFPCYFFDLGRTSYPGTVFVSAFNTNFTNSVPRSVKIFGVNKQYIGIQGGATSTANFLDRAIAVVARTNAGCMMRWE